MILWIRNIPGIFTNLFWNTFSNEALELMAADDPMQPTELSNSVTPKTIPELHTFNKYCPSKWKINFLPEKEKVIIVTTGSTYPELSSKHRHFAFNLLLPQAPFNWV